MLLLHHVCQIQWLQYSFQTVDSLQIHRLHISWVEQCHRVSSRCLQALTVVVTTGEDVELTCSDGGTTYFNLPTEQFS